MATAVTALLPIEELLAAEQTAVKTGGARMVPIEGGKYRVWTKRVGRGATKVLLLHGGPGLTHEYFECFEDFLPQQGIEFYYYDQLDSAYSDKPNDERLWNVARFTDEIEAVRKELGLQKFILLGQSWGGLLAMEYALKYQQHLSGLVISNMVAGIPEYMEYAAKLLAATPDDVQKSLAKYAAEGKYDDPRYVQLMLEHVYSKNVCRLNPWPEPLERSIGHWNTKIYNYLQGPNEFVITGTLKDWSRFTDLPKINVPTLIVGGAYDTMEPAQLERMGKLIPNSRVYICPNGSHLAMYDDQENYFRELLAFGKSVGQR
jgi:proline iminopeptidase